MTKIVRVAARIPASTDSSEKSDNGNFVVIGLFSGIGLLISLLAIIMGVPGAWY